MDSASVTKQHSHTVSELSDFSQDEEKRLVRKIDLMLMPTIWVLYLFSYADRTK